MDEERKSKAVMIISIIGFILCIGLICLAVYNVVIKKLILEKIEDPIETTQEFEDSEYTGGEENDDTGDGRILAVVDTK